MCAAIYIVLQSSCLPQIHAALTIATMPHKCLQLTNFPRISLGTCNQPDPADMATEMELSRQSSPINTIS